ncbi:MAG: pyridoxal 5'-phosphate synthase glutaminase subunit PdxT [Acidimicrobiales bacterium]|nr:pyridoxal 5'-phosphate synthase glutaminase subunit PdxT [Acidimicrobiales bacterium]
MPATVGVLALQGAFAVHAAILENLGAATIEVRTAEQLASVDALVIPGGESTTISMLLERSAMLEPLRARLDEGLPVLGTCAGMILLASEISDGRDDQHALGAIDLAVTRNGYGRQIDSFEADIDVAGLDAPFHAVFIRAPVVERVGNAVEVLAEVDDQAVLCTSGSVTVAAFHPELSDDDRIHRQWLDRIGG